VVLFTMLGYFMGNIPWVKENLKLVVLIIILTSFLPIVVQFVKSKLGKKTA
jgi:membrane-associated protein